MAKEFKPWPKAVEKAKQTRAAYEQRKNVASSEQVQTMPSSQQVMDRYESLIEKGRAEDAEKYLAVHGKSEAEPRITTEKEYVYEGEISPTQLSEMRKWAGERGARIEVGEGMTTRAGEVISYRIISPTELRQEQITKRQAEEAIMGKPLEGMPRILTPQYTQTDVLITRIPSAETIERKEKEAAMSRAVERAISPPDDMIEKTIKGGQLHVTTLFGAYGEKYVASYVPYIPVVAPVTAPLILPYVKGFEPPEAVVKETVAYEFRMAEEEQGKIVKFPISPTVTHARDVLKISPDVMPLKEPEMPAVLQRKLTETATSPPIVIASSVVGGFALGASAKAVAFAGTTAGKITLPATAITLTAPAAYDIAVEPDIQTKTGKALTLGGALVGGGIGYKLGAMKLAKTPTEVELSLADVKGVSISAKVPKTQKIISKSDFKVRLEKLPSGKELVIKGKASYETLRTGPKTAKQDVMIDIPKQKAIELKYPKIGKDVAAFAEGKPSRITIKPQSYERFAAVKEVAPKEYAAKASDIALDIPGGERIMLGAERALSRVKLFREQQLGSTMRRQYKGLAYSETAKEVDIKIAFDARTNRLITDVTRTGVRKAQASRVNWLDIELKKTMSNIEKATKIEPIGKAKPGKPATSLEQVTEPKLELKAESPTEALKGLKVTVKGPRGELGLKSPRASYASLTAGATLQEMKIGLASISGLRQIEKAQQGLKEMPLQMPKAITALEQVPSMVEELRIGLITIPGEKTIIEEKQDQTIEQALRQATRTKTIEEMTEINIPPMPPTPEIPIPTGGGLMGFPLFPKISFGKARPTRYKLKTVISPIPKTLKVREPKIELKI